MQKTSNARLTVSGYGYDTGRSRDPGLAGVGDWIKKAGGWVKSAYGWVRRVSEDAAEVQAAIDQGAEIYSEANPPPSTTAPPSEETQIMNSWGGMFPAGVWCKPFPPPGFLPGGTSFIRASLVQYFASDAELDELAALMRDSFSGDGPRAGAELRKVKTAFWVPALYGAGRGCKVIPFSTKARAQKLWETLVETYREMLVYDPEVQGPIDPADLSPLDLTTPADLPPATTRGAVVGGGAGLLLAAAVGLFFIAKPGR